MKLLIIATIVLVIPLFFLFMLVMSTVSELAQLRKRCHELRERVQAAAAAKSMTGPVPDLRTDGDFDLAVERYHAARRKFPGNLLAAWCGFHEMEHLPDQAIAGGCNGPCDRRAS